MYWTTETKSSINIRMNAYEFIEQLLEDGVDIDDVTLIEVPLRELLIMQRDNLIDYIPDNETFTQGKRYFMQRPIRPSTEDTGRFYYTKDQKKREIAK